MSCDPPWQCDIVAFPQHYTAAAARQRLRRDESSRMAQKVVSQGPPVAEFLGQGLVLPCRSCCNVVASVKNETTHAHSESKQPEFALSGGFLPVGCKNSGQWPTSSTRHCRRDPNFTDLARTWHLAFGVWHLRVQLFIEGIVPLEAPFNVLWGSFLRFLFKYRFKVPFKVPFEALFKDPLKNPFNESFSKLPLRSLLRSFWNYFSQPSFNCPFKIKFKFLWKFLVSKFPLKFRFKVTFYVFSLSTYLIINY